MWKGFIPESKNWMSYSRMTFWGKVNFWRRVPVVYFKFKIWLPFKDWAKSMWRIWLTWLGEEWNVR